MPIFELICLANSRKHNGRCVAGLSLDGKGWIRPVSAMPDGTLFPQHYRLSDGSDPQLMDVFQVELVKPRPEQHQPENWIIGRSTWRLMHRNVAIDDYRAMLRAFRVHGPDLFGNSADRVEFNQLLVQPAAASLALVVVRSVEFLVTTSASGHRQIRALFNLRGTDYNLGVTDPRWEKQLAAVPIGTAQLFDNVMMTISLGEPFNGFCFKLVAAVIPL